MSTRDVTDNDKNDADAASYNERVAAATRLLANSIARIDDIIANFHEPPEPDKQAIIDALTALKVKAADASARADTLLLRIRPA